MVMFCSVENTTNTGASKKETNQVSHMHFLFQTKYSNTKISPWTTKLDSKDSRHLIFRRQPLRTRFPLVVRLATKRCESTFWLPWWQPDELQPSTPCWKMQQHNTQAQSGPVRSVGMCALLSLSLTFCSDKSKFCLSDAIRTDGAFCNFQLSKYF